MNKTIRPPSEIESEKITLLNRVDNIEVAIKQLHEKLSPVLKGGIEATDREEKIDNPSTEIGRTFRNASDRIRRVEDAIYQIIGDLAL